MANRAWIVGLALVGGASLSSPAWALTTGQCLPAAQVRSALAAENMNPIIVGNRTGYGYPTSFIFFAGSGRKGYLIRGDKPLGQQAETACVDSEYRDVRLNDITRPGVPAWAKMGNAAAKAIAICKRDHLGYQEECRAHDQSLATMNGNGLRVMLTAVGTAINPRDKSIRSEQTLLLTLDAADGGGLLNASTPEGASYMLSAYTKGSYTQYGTALLQRQDVP